MEWIPKSYSLKILLYLLLGVIVRWDWVLLYPGQGVFYETGCHCALGLGVTVPVTGYYSTQDWVFLWDWVLLYLLLGVFSVGLGATGCVLWDRVSLYSGWLFSVRMGAIVPTTGCFLWDGVLLYLGLGVFCGSGAYSVCITPCWKLRFVALLIGIGGRLADEDVGSFCCFLLVPGLPSGTKNCI